MQSESELFIKEDSFYQCLSMLQEQYPLKKVAGFLGVNIDTITDWIKFITKKD